MNSEMIDAITYCERVGLHGRTRGLYKNQQCKQFGNNNKCKTSKWIINLCVVLLIITTLGAAASVVKTSATDNSTAGYNVSKNWTPPQPAHLG